MRESKEEPIEKTSPPSYYLISQDVQLSSGDFALQLPDGQVVLVDETAVSPYQITREEAEAIIEDQLRKGLAQTQAALRNLLALNQAAPAETSTPESEAENPVNGRSLAHDLLGFTPTELEQNPEQIKEKLDTLFNGIKSFLENVTADSEEGLEAAHTQMQSFRQTLDKHGIATHDNMEQLPDKIHDLFHHEPQDRDAQFAADLQKLADKIRETAVSYQSPPPPPQSHDT